MEIAVDRVGQRKTPRVLSFILQWQIARDALGHDPTIEEYAAWWKESRATAYRHLSLFREAFPSERDPTKICDLLSAHMDRRKGVASLGRLPLPGVA
jgi:hypothetical protein